MFRRVIAVSFVAIWFILFGVEFCEELGFFDYDEPETDRAVETTLATFGEAIKSSDDSQATLLHFSSFQPVALHSPIIQSILMPGFREETNHAAKEDIKIYRLNRSFLL